MNQSVYGVYNSTQEAMDAIDKIKGRGFEDHVFTLIARDEKDLAFKNADQSLEVNVITTLDHDHEDSFFQKVMRFFMEVEPQLDDHLKENGASEAEANRYMEQIEAGKIVVMIEEKKK
ncbi:hypothetical protein JOC77_002200 [Peribacillus deserti]|uniref:General stress protein 17M-like domain-containing protein n=1 Tax=Peribacillus deserti TaxID=673318 RepID=A0ABS2QI05_9BACI|nr:general stress protein [Peribacillus deserti]MBM7692769.1 hypothetical protein [Peribacillus deserti]